MGEGFLQSRTITISIQTNSSDFPEPRARLTLVRSRQLPYVFKSTDTVNFGAFSQSSHGESVLIQTYESITQKSAWIQRAVCTLDGVEVKGGLVDEMALPEGEAVLRSYHFDVNIVATPKIGEFSAEVLFFGNSSERAPLLSIPVRGSVRSPVFATPASLYARITQTEDLPRLKVVLTCDDSAFPLAARPLDQPIKVRVRELSRSGNRIVFEVIPPHFTECSEESRSQFLLFETNHPDMQILKVPLLIERSRSV
jgi:hypothetical protein